MRVGKRRREKVSNWKSFREELISPDNRPDWVGLRREQLAFAGNETPTHWKRHWAECKISRSPTNTRQGSVFSLSLLFAWHFHVYCSSEQGNGSRTCICQQRHTNTPTHWYTETPLGWVKYRMFSLLFTWHFHVCCSSEEGNMIEFHHIWKYCKQKIFLRPLNIPTPPHDEMFSSNWNQQLSEQPISSRLRKFHSKWDGKKRLWW